MSGSDGIEIYDAAGECILGVIPMSAAYCMDGCMAEAFACRCSDIVEEAVTHEVGGAS